MRIGVVWDPDTSAANYRALYPLREMVVRGHTVVWPEGPDGVPDLDRLWGCDVIHAYRRFDRASLEILSAARRMGSAIVWDNDDDLAAIPEESPRHRETGGVRGERIFRETVAAAKLASVVTVPTPAMAELYRSVGIPRVVVLANRVLPLGERARVSHPGCRIGWIAGMEHQADIARLGIRGALERVQDRHPHVDVVSIGVDIGLSERYVHRRFVPFGDLPGEIGGFDIGIAPLSDIPFNRTRSDIKVKEYAACGVPWLASDSTAYRGLGPQQGGELVGDDEWFQSLDRLVGDADRRRRLGRAGRSWAATQTIRRAAREWEAVFEGAVSTIRLRRGEASRA